jgi:hypothetical protein
VTLVMVLQSGILILALATTNHWLPEPHSADWTAIGHIGEVDHPIPTIWIAHRRIVLPGPVGDPPGLTNRLFLVEPKTYDSISTKIAALTCKKPSHSDVTGELIAQSTHGNVRTVCAVEGPAVCRTLSRVIQIAVSEGEVGLAHSVSYVADLNGCPARRP